MVKSNKMGQNNTSVQYNEYVTFCYICFLKNEFKVTDKVKNGDDEISENINTKFT